MARLGAQKTHLGDIANSSLSGSGSDHTRSAIGPSCGISAKQPVGAQRRESAIADGTGWRLWPTSEAVDDLDLVDAMH